MYPYQQMQQERETGGVALSPTAGQVVKGQPVTSPPPAAQPASPPPMYAQPVAPAMYAQPVSPPPAYGAQPAYAQPAYAQPAYAQPAYAPVYAQQAGPVSYQLPNGMVVMPQVSAGQPAPAGQKCTICTLPLVGIVWKCEDCRKNGRPYYLCVPCHGRQKKTYKGFLDEIRADCGSELFYNTTSERPHETWHSYEQVGAFGVAQPAQPMAQIPRFQVQLSFSCSQVPRSGFGLSAPDPQVMVQVNGKEVLVTEEQRGTSNPSFNRRLDISSDEAKLTFLVYNSGTKCGVATAQMSEILRAPGGSFSKSLDDPKTGYRLSSGTINVRWVQTSAPAPAAMAPPAYGYPVGGAPMGGSPMGAPVLSPVAGGAPMAGVPMASAPVVYATPVHK